MNISSVKYILFSFMISCLLTTLSFTTVYAEDSENGCIRKEISEKVTEAATNSANQLASELKTYNQLVENYQSQCGTIEVSATSMSSGMSFAADMAAYSKMLPITKDDFNFTYTAIDWSKVTPTNSTCQQKKNEAQNQFAKLKSVYTTAHKNLELFKNNESIACECDKEGHVIGNCSVLPQKAEKEVEYEGTCLTFQEYVMTLSVCPLCPVFEVILSTNAKIASVAWNRLAAPLSKVVTVFFLALLALETLKVVSAFVGTSPGTYLKTVLTLGLKVAITLLILSDPHIIYENFISPVIKGGLDMGLAIVNSTSNGPACNILSSSGIIASDVLDHSLLDSILGAVRCFNTSATTMPAVGRGLVCYGWEDLSLKIWFIGLIIMVFGYLIWLAVSFYLIDCTVQLGVLTALVPLLVACWPFKMTQSYSYKGVTMLMNTFFCYVLIGLLILMGTEIVGYAASGNGGAGMEDYQHAMNNNDLEGLKKLFAEFNFLSLLLLISCGVFAMKLVGKTQQLADNFAQGSGANIGANIGGMIASAAKSTAKGAGKLATKGGGKLLKKGVSGAKGHLNKKDSPAAIIRQAAQETSTGSDMGDMIKDASLAGSDMMEKAAEKGVEEVAKAVAVTVLTGGAGAGIVAAEAGAEAAAASAEATAATLSTTAEAAGAVAEGTASAVSTAAEATTETAASAANVAGETAANTANVAGDAATSASNAATNVGDVATNVGEGGNNIVSGNEQAATNTSSDALHNTGETVEGTSPNNLSNQTADSTQTSEGDSTDQGDSHDFEKDMEERLKKKLKEGGDDNDNDELVKRALEKAYDTATHEMFGSNNDDGDIYAQNISENGEDEGEKRRSSADDMSELPPDDRGSLT